MVRNKQKLAIKCLIVVFFFLRRGLSRAQGSLDVHPRVLSALSRPTIGHLDPQFIDLMESIKKLLRSAFKTNNRLTLPLSAPGSAAMEAAFEPY